ncbi:hypothetical protein [Leptolyngbya sp. CCNP1308]|uniref:hypothetical protein n=1 Tax=Leptolyngbya sp. CCNP1308 TaxID=3110255 RepID=UPI002B20ED32|nr:hypothetical protein [Leptolyngbya sp. CCNP1308]
MGFCGALKKPTTMLLSLIAGGALGLIGSSKAVAQQPVTFNSISSPVQIAQAQRATMTWQTFVSFMQANGEEFTIATLPQSFPNGFANGQVALTALHTAYSSYVVAREGVTLPNMSTVRQQINQNNSFNTLTPGSTFDQLPALATFPITQYNASNVIEVVHWAARYDDEGVRAVARRSRQQTLPDGRRAYYMPQVGDRNPRTGWCTFEDEQAQYSEYLCVNIANSPQTAFGVLGLIISNPINPRY